MSAEWYRLRLHGIEHSKCNHLTTLGFKGLTFERLNQGTSFTVC